METDQRCLRIITFSPGEDGLTLSSMTDTDKKHNVNYHTVHERDDGAVIVSAYVDVDTAEADVALFVDSIVAKLMCRPPLALYGRTVLWDVVREHLFTPLPTSAIGA